MSSITDQLFNTLQNVQHPGNYYATGILEVFPPHLEVEGVGRIALPLLPIQAEQLVSSAEYAPYGRGQETIVDTQVRRTWQIDANRVTLSGKHWQKNLDDIVNRAAIGLGVSGEVRAELYKLLVYDAGSFFISHRDTEKAAGMFATLVVVLPSEYSGGELVVKHQQQQVKLDLCCDDPSEIAFAAFYADCVHEVLPITQGCRLTLIYNLLRTDKKMPLPKPPDYHREQDEVTSLLRNWAGELSTDPHEEIPEKLIYLLEHAYTPAELGFDALKNADAAVAEVLVAAAGQADCEIHLALVSMEESGSAEYAGSGRYWDDDDFEVGEIIDRMETVSEWRRPDGQPSQLPVLPFSADEFCPPKAFEDMETDDVQFHEATGNEGASFERTYRCAALVIWPRARYLAIINQAGLSVTLPVLHDFCWRWENETKDPNSSLWHEAHTLAGYMLRDWLPEDFGSRNIYQGNSNVGDFLDYMCRLRDSEHLGRFWSMVAANGFYHKEYSSALVQAAELLPWTDVVNWAKQAITVSAVNAQEACAALLLGLSLTKTGTAQDLSAAAHALFTALPGDPERFPQLQPWERSRTSVNIDLVVDILTCFSAIDAALAENTLNYLLAWPATYDMDKILAPAALQLTETAICRELPVVERLRNAVRMHLHTRVAETLEPPADWRRDSQISCTCRDCAELRTFLDNPDQSRWSFKAAEAKRKHIEYSIQRHRCDVNYDTNRSSRPYSLVCTKNKASYQRRVEQRNNDLDALARLTVE
jgi:predicted 2-oxoglutarate/Fe(II)-dependent dioxygenase YbiX